MTITTHTSASCLLTVWTLSSGPSLLEKILILTLGSLMLHFTLDLFPHGFIATPVTIFKKTIPTILELVPGPVILIAAILTFGHPVWFVVATAFGLLPDILTTFLLRFGSMAERVPFVRWSHILHRKVHWFETDKPDGTIVLHVPNHPVLAIEGVFMAAIVALLFMQPAF